jgi:hypothetical protein
VSLRLASFDKIFWLKIWSAIQKILGGVILALVHWGWGILYSHISGESSLVLRIMSVGFSVAVIVIYFILLIEMIKVFLPKRVRTIVDTAMEGEENDN